jgi:hypothetical protein
MVRILFTPSAACRRGGSHGHLRRRAERTRWQYRHRYPRLPSRSRPRTGAAAKPCSADRFRSLPHSLVHTVALAAGEGPTSLVTAVDSSVTPPPRAPCAAAGTVSAATASPRAARLRIQFLLYIFLLPSFKPPNWTKMRGPIFLGHHLRPRGPHGDARLVSKRKAPSAGRSASRAEPGTHAWAGQRGAEVRRTRSHAEVAEVGTMCRVRPGGHVFSRPRRGFPSVRAGAGHPGALPRLRRGGLRGPAPRPGPSLRPRGRWESRSGR